MKKFWLYIEPYVSITLEMDKVLYYNTLNKEHLIFNEVEIIKITKKIKNDKNFMVLGINEDKLNTSPYKEFIHKLRSTFSGDIIDATWSKCKPIQIVPKLRRRVASLYSNKNWYGDGISTYLNELTIYLNGDCEQMCVDCKNYYKQIIFCKKSNCKDQIPLENIEQLLKNAKSSTLMNVNFTGGNIFKYEGFKKLIYALKGYNCNKVFHINFAHIKNEINPLLKLITETECHIKVLINSPINLEQLFYVLDLSKKLNLELVFTIDSIATLTKIEELIKTSEITNYNLVPFYNKDNINFFIENVFLTLDDIKDASPDQDTLISRTAINQNEFGKLTILNDGNVYSNINEQKIGNIHSKNLEELLICELTSGNSWKKRRQFLIPCKNCVYNLICPPISNYERVIGKSNLCHVKPT